MKSRLIPELQNSFDSFFDPVGVEASGNQEALLSAGVDGGNHPVNTPSDVLASLSYSDQGPNAAGDAVGLPAPDRTDALQVSHLALDPTAPEEGGVAIAGGSLQPVSTTFPAIVMPESVPAFSALPASWFAAVNTGASSSSAGAFEALAQTGFQMVHAGLDTVAPVISGAVATAAVSFDHAAAAVAPIDMAELANPATGSINPITSAAVGSGGATAAQVQQALNESGLSVNGSGIKVGVISDSFNNLGGAAADEADGALPSASNVQVLEDDPTGTGTDEGRAMMQIIHDIAPGASLAFYTADVSEQDFANGILALAAAGCKVICDDVGYFDEPFFQNGVVAQAIQTVEAEGVTYVTAAGNNASNAYQAAWTPISASVDGHALVDAETFNGSILQTITLTASKTEDVPLLLEWNQAYGQAASDLEILVFHNGLLVGTATNRSSGEPNNPWAYYDFTASGTYQIAIENLSGPDPTLIKEVTEGDGLPVTISGANAGTVYGHSMTPGAITAGAVSTAATPAFSGKTPVSESFSSSGLGTELLFANNGTPLSSPDALNPVAVSGVDDISTTVSGGLSDFYGTSAASASLAGVAAVLLSANPNLTPAQVEQIMEQTATPMANSAVSGAGLVNVSAGVAAAKALAGTVIESFGSTSLVQVGNDFYLDPTSGGTGVELKYQNAPVVVGQVGAWTPIGAEATSSGYEIAWKVPGANQFAVWNLDSTGNYVSIALGTSSGGSAALESYELSFHQDLNGDGVIGVPPPQPPGGTVIESFGLTSLVQVNNDFYLDPTSGGTGVELKYQNAPVVVGQVGAWTPIGAELTSSGYEIAWKVPGADQYAIWNLDSTGNYVSTALGTSSGSSAALESYEPGFHQDLNGDGVIGVPLQQPPGGTVIELFGSTSLVQVNNDFYLDPTSGGTGVEMKYEGTPVVVGQLGAWTPIGAEATSSGYEVAWKVPGADQYAIWNLDSTGNYVSTALGTSSGSSAALESYEPSFHQDLNGDGVIGVPPGGQTSGVASANNSSVQSAAFMTLGAGDDAFWFNSGPDAASSTSGNAPEKFQPAELFPALGDQHWAAINEGAATQAHPFLPSSYGTPDASVDPNGASSGLHMDAANFHLMDMHAHSFILG